MKRTKKLSFSAILITIVLAFAAFALAACNNSSDPKKDEFKLSQTSVSVMVGKNATITASGTDEEIVWTADNDEVISLTTVKKVCTIKALAEGTATVTAIAGDLTATCSVTVTPDNTETVTVTLNGAAVTEASVDMGATITLSATASQGSPINWVSSNEDVATVENGVVTGVKPGTTTVSAQVTASIKADVLVTVNSVGGYEYYNLTLDKGAADANEHPGTWAYWTEWAQFTKLNYDNGTVNLTFTENGGNWYNLQLFYVNAALKTDKYYKLTLDIETSVAGHVTINGNVLSLQQGKHSYEVYFTNSNSFSMQFGVEGGIDGVTSNIIDMPAATVAISNIVYTEDTARVTLAAPSFTYDNASCVITISNSNSAGVKHYILNLYQNGRLVTGVTVAKSGVIDWSMISSGTYEARLKAVAANVHYLDSAESNAVTIEVVNEGGLRYSFYNIPAGDSTPKDAGGATAKQTPGIWTYWTESWVTINGEFADGKLTVTFSNNQGNWYDTQLNYRHPDLETGKTYKLQLEINSTAGGRVTLNGVEFTIEMGTKVYDIVFTENGGLSLQFTFGLDGKNQAQEITAATMIFTVKGVEETTAQGGNQGGSNVGNIGYSEEGSFSSGWVYWDSKTSADWNQWTEAHCTECNMDENGKITTSFTVSGSGAMWAMQMFYKSDVAADKYNSSLSITASVDTTIIVCGQTIELKAGVKTAVNTENFKSDNGSAILIQFGLTGGTFTIEDVNVTAA